MTGRRRFIAAIAGGVVTPLAVAAQPPRDVRVGVVFPGGQSYSPMLEGLREGLKALGLESGTHYTLHVRETKEIYRRRRRPARTSSARDSR